MLTVSGCGGGTATDVTPSKPVDSSTLTGMWAGSLNGDGPNSFGYTTTLTELRADSTLTMTAATQPYGTLTGAWTVSAGKWISTGHDQTNTIITLTAPLSALTPTGTWTASSGRTGSFTMAKLP